MAGCNLCEHWSIRSSQLYRTGGVCFRRPNRFYGYFDHRGDVLALQRNIAYFPSPSFGRAKSNEALIESKLSSLSFPGESQGITIGNGKRATIEKLQTAHSFRHGREAVQWRRERKGNPRQSSDCRTWSSSRLP